MKIEHENTFVKCLQEGINLFTGAGFSILAKDRQGKNLPLGTGLKDEIVNEMKLHDYSSLDLPQLSTIAESENSTKFRSYLVDRFTTGNISHNYDSLFKCNIKTIFTTNIDDLIYRIYERSNSHYLVDITRVGAVHSDKNAIHFAPLHGCVNNRESKLTFSTTDLASSFSTNHGEWMYLKQILAMHPTVFIGYGLHDNGTLQSIADHLLENRTQKDKWITLHEENQTFVKYFKALGFKIIVAKIDEILEFFTKISLNTIKAEIDSSFESKFKHFVIPGVGTSPERPLKEFFSGETPTWSDIYSRQICKTSHFDRIMDRIHSKQNLAVIGIPGSGKTTLMMQTALATNFAGNKIVCDILNTEQAKLVANYNKSKRLIAFIDNFADNVEAVNILAATGNTQIIGFDRDVVFETSSHLIKFKYDLVSVTGLPPADINNVYRTIPVSIRKDRLEIPRVSSRDTPSIFELMETNLNVPTLSTRYQHMLSKLAQADIALHDYLVMTCYVHACRTPVSFDMAFAFMRKWVANHKEFYERVNKISSLVSDYIGIGADNEQDYFEPRSFYVSEAVLNKTNRDDFKRIFVNFHQNVSPYRIANFDKFKRKAYSSDFAKKAFSEWQEGYDFFQFLYSRDKSYYLLQQAALYSLGKKRYHEAFQLIDQALLKAGNFAFSIKNSHAIILFEANIHHASQDNIAVRKSLDDSLSILQECYKADKRKRYHAIKYANFCLEYWDAYQDSIAKDHLLTSQTWLEEELRNASWNYEMKFVLGNIKRKIQSIA